MEVLDFSLLRLLPIILHSGIHGMCALPGVYSLNICNAALPALLDPVVRFRHPSGGLPGLDAVIVQLIDLFKRQALGLGDEEVGEDKTAETSSSPDEEHLGAQAGVSGSGFDQVRGRIADSPVPEPVGGGGHRHSLGTNALISSDWFECGNIREDKVRR